MSTNERPSRASSLAELDALAPVLFSKESRRRGLAFEPRASDVIISPYAKCGTTWLQQIAHGLRTRGSMDFEEITVVVPWLEVADQMGWDLDAPHVAEPRLYKSHVSWHEVPKGARYICSFRDPADAFVSFYRFFEGFVFEPRTIGLEDFFRWRWPRDRLGEFGYWHHLASWWEQRHDARVLLLCYEDMQVDLEGTVRRIARFIGIDVDEELLAVVVRQSSRDFMLAHRHQFDEAPFRRHWSERGVLPFDSDAGKVTVGATDSQRYHLSPALREELDAIWAERISSRFGLASYEELRREVGLLHADGA